MPRLEDSIMGYVYNDDRFEDGALIVTSRVKRLDEITAIAVTQNTTYELGKRHIDSCNLICE